MANPKPFTDKVIAITGASGGIGLATARFLAARGATLAISDLSESIHLAVREIRNTYGTPVHGTCVDISVPESVDAWINDTVTRFGRLDGAANIAGTNGTSSFGKAGGAALWDTPPAEYDHINTINARGMFICLSAQLRAMGCGDATLKIKSNTVPPSTGAPSLGHRGSVVNIASIAGVSGRPNNSAYTASKHAVVGLTRTAAKEAGEWGVRVNCVAPGYVDTKMMVYLQEEVEGLALKRVGTPEEVASLIGWLLGNESTYVTGEVYNCMGGWPGVI